MILACHQPQYLAWLGNYHKMARCDVFVYLDQVQFKKREFQNRNRIKTPAGPQWLTLPVLTRGRFDQRVREVELDPTRDWPGEHWKALSLNYGKAPFFAEHEAYLKDLYARPWRRLLDLCLDMDAYARGRLGIGPRVALESESGSEGSSTARIVSLCRGLGADVYLSGRGGKDYLDEPAFAAAGIRLEYQDFRPPEYPQRFSGFEPNLCALDLLLNCGSTGSRDLLARL